MNPTLSPAWPLADLELAHLQSAWERVRDNEGCAGVDAVTVEQFSRQAPAGLPELRLQLRAGSYFPLPLRRIDVAKHHSGHEFRTLLVPTVRDRVAQTAIGRTLAHDWEQQFLLASFAYRPGLGLDRAISHILSLRDAGWTWVVDADISDYFNSIPHKLLEHNLAAQPIDPAVRTLLHRWIHGYSWDGRHVLPLKRGIAQGSPLSPLLANFFLTPFDEALERLDARLIRYSDDFIVLCRSENAAREALAAAYAWMGRNNLRLRPDKTGITNFEQGFHYLGIAFRGREAMVPWKPKLRMGRIVSIAAPMPKRALTLFRNRFAAAPSTQPTVPHAAATIPITEAPQLEMPFLYVTQPGSVIRRSGERFLVECDQHIVLDCPLHRLESILLFGNVQITSQAVSEALDHGIGVSFFSRRGRFRGALSPGFGRNVDLRLAQYHLYQDRPAALGWAKFTVRHKIANGLAVLDRYRDRGRDGPRTEPLEDQMRAASRDLENAASLAEVDGFEGAAAKAYFEALFIGCNRSAFTWPGRIKHPATDPLNALLSLGYTLLMNEILGLIESRSLDPAIGFLHELDGNRPSLALDLMEPFRHPVIDRMVLTAVNRGMFTPDDFAEGGEENGWTLHPAALRRFLEEYERCMLAPMSQPATFRTALREELDRFARALRGTSPWTPFSFDPPPDPAVAPTPSPKP